MDDPARQRARELANTPEFAKAQRQRKKVEALFAELKNQIGLRRLRRLKFVRRAVFPGGGCPEHQAIGPFPQPKATTNVGRDDVAVTRCEEELVPLQHSQPRQDLLSLLLFQHPRDISIVVAGQRL
jgi:hypothetical protein